MITSVNLYTIPTGSIVPAGPGHCPGVQGSVEGFAMSGKRRDAQRQLFRFGLKNGAVVSDGVGSVRRQAVVEAWNRLIDRAEPSAYIEPLLEPNRKPTGSSDDQQLVQT